MNGECLCGAVRFEITPPLSAIELCHCSRCQHASGSAFAAGFYVRSANFRWLTGQGHITIYEAPLLRDPPPYKHCFCRTCGSPVPVAHEAASLVEIPAGVVQTQPGARVGYHMWFSKKAAWWDMTRIAGLPTYETAPPLGVRVGVD